MRSPMLAFSLFAVVGPTIVAAAPSSPTLGDDPFAHTKGTDVRLSQRQLPQSPVFNLGFLLGPSSGVGLPNPSKAKASNDDEVSRALPNEAPREAADTPADVPKPPAFPAAPVAPPAAPVAPPAAPVAPPAAPVAPAAPAAAHIAPPAPSPPSWNAAKVSTPQAADDTTKTVDTVPDA
ncbi:hypothetical protein L227DRAFT_572968 [Lentinus tigrinus ALCF2SS1-6]|uniref:Uncharacterized protein n=1 Tax=Lentinus tigrinus ALCF2SS1-6 TaxID=1328759 RepID=A0A5C2SNU0_9APHY|nr:hypothetical protein L227DRAFT_572968 [Lentinus tigrinus ALCF2SS1-6]